MSAYFLDFSRRGPPPVSDHFVVHQGWSLTGELTVYLTLRADPSPVWLLAFKKTIYLITSTIWCGTHSRVRLLADNPPSPGEVGHTTGFYVPYSVRTVVWVLLRPARTRTTVFRPYPRRLEILIVCTCHCKGSTFPSGI